MKRLILIGAVVLVILATGTAIFQAQMYSPTFFLNPYYLGPIPYGHIWQGQLPNPWSFQWTGSYEAGNWPNFLSSQPFVYTRAQSRNQIVQYTNHSISPYGIPMLNFDGTDIIMPFSSADRDLMNPLSPYYYLNPTSPYYGYTLPRKERIGDPSWTPPPAGMQGSEETK